MKKQSLGANRLSILCGILGSIVWFIFILIVYEGFLYGLDIDELLIVFEGILIGFLVPFILVRGIFWVIAGFEKDKNSINN